jgi:hypothetical protein
MSSLYFVYLKVSVLSWSEALLLIRSQVKGLHSKELIPREELIPPWDDFMEESIP